MIKFVVHCLRGKTSIVEVSCQLITGVEDPSIMWLPEGEFRARIIAPAFLLDKVEGGGLESPIWHSHAFCWTVHQAWVVAEHQIRTSFELNKRKHGVEYTEENVKAKLAEVQEVLL